MLSKYFIPVYEASRDILPSIRGVVIPLLSRVQMNPLTWWSSTSLAHTIPMSAMGLLVIQVLTPLMIHLFLPLSNLQVVLMLAGSLPAPGSVNPKHPTNLPAANSGSSDDLTSSFAYSSIGNITNEDCTERADLYAESMRSIS